MEQRGEFGDFSCVCNILFPQKIWSELGITLMFEVEARRMKGESQQTREF